MLRLCLQRKSFLFWGAATHLLVLRGYSCSEIAPGWHRGPYGIPGVPGFKPGSAECKTIAVQFLQPHVVRFSENTLR